MPLAWWTRRRALVLPVAGAYLHWGWQQPTAGRTWQLEVRTEAPGGVGQYLALDNGTIDGGGFYLGVQTDMFRPGRGPVGPGVIFSSWASRTADTVEVAPGGYAEIGDHEGGFVGVRLPLRLHPGRWSFTLTRGPQVGAGDRFVLTATPPGAAPLPAGSMVFPRSRPDVPATIGPGGTGFWELYSGTASPDGVPRWELGVMAEGCPSGAVSYPTFPDRPPFTAVDAWHDPATGLVEVRAGAGVRREHPPGRWP